MTSWKTIWEGFHRGSGRGKWATFQSVERKEKDIPDKGNNARNYVKDENARCV